MNARYRRSIPDLQLEVPSIVPASKRVYIPFELDNPNLEVKVHAKMMIDINDIIKKYRDGGGFVNSDAGKYYVVDWEGNVYQYRSPPVLNPVDGRWMTSVFGGFYTKLFNMKEYLPFQPLTKIIIPAYHKHVFEIINPISPDVKQPEAYDEKDVSEFFDKLSKNDLETIEKSLQEAIHKRKLSE